MSAGNAHLRRQREEALYRSEVGGEALKRQRALQSLSGLCTCGNEDPAFKSSRGDHHHPGCPNYRRGDS